MSGDLVVDNQATVARDPQRQKLFEELFERVSEVSSLPTVAMQVAQVADDPSTGTNELFAAVQADPAIAARIMRIVNSAYFGLRQPVADLKTAITMVGFREVRNLALTFYVAQLFKETQGHRFYTREALWDHLVAVATAAQLISIRFRKARSEEAYLAGLLHDLGLILIDEHLNRHFCQIIDGLDEDTPTWRVERTILQFDHAEMGAYAASKWHFPEQIADAIHYHHFPEEYDGPHRELIDTVALANYLCSRKGKPSIGIHNLPVPNEALFMRLGVTREDLSTIWQDLEEALDKADILAGV